MTSTTYSESKLRQGRSFFLWSLYTGKTTMIIYLSLLTFLCLITTIFGLGISLQMPSQAAEIWQGASVFTIIFTVILAFVFTFVFSIKEFSYLHDKRKTDMFGALPASRRTVFFAKLAAVIIQSAAPMLIILIFIAVMNFGALTDYIGFSQILREPTAGSNEINLLYEIVHIFIGLVANAVFLGFLSVCCGRTADKILTYLIINAAYPISALLVQTLPGSFIIGYTSDINEFFTCALAPCTASWSINPAYWGGFSVLFGALCFFLLPKRKAECAQSHFAFKAPLVITKVLVSFAAGMVSAYMFSLIFSLVGTDRITFIVGWALGSFIAYFVFQIIFAKGFKRFGWGMIPYGVLVVCFAVIMVVTGTGLFGYESYVPSVDEVESVSLIGEKQLVVDGKSIIDGTITDKNQIADCIEGHKEVIGYLKEHRPSISQLTFGVQSYDISDDYYYSGAVQFTYKLKNGMTVSRHYGVYPDNELKFTSTDTYIINTDTLFLVDPEHVTDIYFDSDYENDDYDAEIEVDGVKYALDDSSFGTKEKRNELIGALRSDILAYGSNSGDSLCYVNIEYGNGLYSFDSDTYVDVRSTFKKTLELLKNSAVKKSTVGI